MLTWKYLRVEEMKVHTQFQNYTVTAAMQRIPVWLLTQLHLLNCWFPECFKSAVIKENVAAGQEVALLQAVKDNAESSQLCLKKRLCFSCDVTK